MHSSPASAGDLITIPHWRPWDRGAYATLATGGPVRIYPAPWLAPHQARRLHDLLDDLLTYQCLYRRMDDIPDGPRAVRTQVREITADIAALAELRVAVHWRPGVGGDAIELLCRR
ncbi:hypothetical protein [Inquilinus sp. CAU 1745]|uniref:hypothetical protein n=1 Tax=Inquilinus sp. CAU 1745 TaxID=3140369 RepID=UPI00325B80FE